MNENYYNLANSYYFYPTHATLKRIGDSQEDIILGSNESRLLECLISRNNDTVSRAYLINELWSERGVFVDDSSLTQSISTLRKILKDSSKQPIYIRTVPKVGYQFIASVEYKCRSGKKINQHKSKRTIRPLGTLEPSYDFLYSMSIRFALLFVLVIIAEYFLISG